MPGGGKGGTTTRTTQTGTQSQNAYFNNNQSGSTGLDQGSQDFVNWQRAMAQAGAGAVIGGGPLALGANPGMLAALQQMGQSPNAGGQIVSNAGNAINAIVGNDAALKSSIQGFMNPYISGVVDPTRAEFDHLRAMAQNDARGLPADVAFGDRAALVEGARLGEIDRAQGSQMADLYRGGYDQATQTALTQQQQKMQGLAGVAGAGMGLADQDLRRQQMLFDNWNTLRGVEQGALGGVQDILRYGTGLGFANTGLGPTGSVHNTSQSGTNSMSGRNSMNSTTRETRPFDPWSMLGGGLMMASGLGWAPFAG